MKKPLGNWRRLDDGRWWSPDHGSAYRIDGKWWAMNSSNPQVPIEPVVGPFPTARQAMSAYDDRMRQGGTQH